MVALGLVGKYRGCWVVRWSSWALYVVASERQSRPFGVGLGIIAWLMDRW
jgi:hypothetical protein